jgi:hypothetical protein
MDAYHKILALIYELTGGKDSVDVDFVELLKKEGYFPSIDDIREMLTSEGWITESRQNMVRITHWGVAEARKAGTAVRPDADRALERESQKLLGEARALAVVIEEFIADPGDSKRKALAKKFGELQTVYSRLNEL